MTKECKQIKIESSDGIYYLSFLEGIGLLLSNDINDSYLFSEKPNENSILDASDYLAMNEIIVAELKAFPFDTYSR